MVCSAGTFGLVVSAASKASVQTTAVNAVMASGVVRLGITAKIQSGVARIGATVKIRTSQLLPSGAGDTELASEHGHYRAHRLAPQPRLRSKAFSLDLSQVRVVS